MADNRVPVLAPDPETGQLRFATVDKSEVDQLPEGSRVLSAKEAAEKEGEVRQSAADAAVQERYDALPTWQKALGGAAAYAGSLGGPIGLGLTSNTPWAPPTLQAYGHGVTKAVTLGGADALTRAGIDEFAGKEKGAQYAEQVDQLEASSPIAHGIGEGVGMVGTAAIGGGGGAARAIPALGKLAAKGALGRAAVEGATMAVRGAIEGGAYAGAEQVTSDILHDTPVTGEKLYAAVGHGALLGGGLGGALGFGGSLIGSGARGLARRVGAQLERGAAEAEGAIAPLAREESAPFRQAATPAEEAGAAVARPRGKQSIVSMLGDPENAARAAAQDQAWSAVGSGFGLQSTRYAKEAAKYFPNGTRDLGEIGIRHGLIDMGEAADSPLVAAYKAAKSGTAADILPKAEIALEQVGRQIGDITNASGARVPMSQIDDGIAKVRAAYDKYAGNEHVTNEIDKWTASLKSKLGGGEMAPGGVRTDYNVSIQDLLEQRKGLDEIVYRENKQLDPARRVQALRDVRSEIESVITNALDEASNQVPGALKEQYQALKKDYHGLRILQQAAEDSAARSSKAATFGLRDMMAAGPAIASGHFLAAPVLAVGGKLIRERGNAAAAAFLSRAADRGTFNEIVRQFDRRVSKAAQGALREANDGTPVRTRRAASVASDAARRPDPERGRAQVEDTQKKAQTIVKWVGETRANPKQIMDQLQDAAVRVGQTAGPQAAQSYTASTVKAMAFVASYVPVKERRDPLDPRSVPPLTYDEADRLVRAARYAAKPETIFDDFERGKITPEGLRAAKEFVPTAFEEFQTQLQDHVENHLLRNKQLTDSQRLRIDKLLGYPAGAALKPAAIARLQGNLMKAPPEPPPAGPNGGGGPPPPVPMKVQQTGFDAVEARQAAG